MRWLCGPCEWLLVLFLGVFFPRAEAGNVEAPIPISSAAVTRADYNREKTAWMRRTMFESMATNLKGNAWDEQARAFVEKAVGLFHARDDMARRPLIAEGKALIDAGCDDPVVIYLWARIDYEWNKDNDRIKRPLQKALLRFPDTSYPKAVGWMVAMFARQSAKNPEALDEPIGQWVSESFSDGSFRAEEAHLLVRFAVHSELDKIGAQLAAACKSAPIAEWAKETLLGLAAKGLAWRSHDNDSTDAAPEGRDPFAKHLEIAREHFKKAWELQPNRADAAAAMVEVVMAGHGFRGDTLRMWLDRALKAEIDNRFACKGMAWALRPQWGGSHKEMLAFARACLATKRYDTDAPLYYLEILDEIAEDADDWRAIYRQKDVRSELIALVDAFIAEPERREEQAKWRQFLGLYACAFNDPETAARAGPVEAELYPEVKEKLKIFGLNRQEFEEKLAALATPGGREFAEAEEKFGAFQNGEAERLYESGAARIAPSQPPTLVARRLAAISLERELESGKWIKLTPDLRSWAVESGDWSVQPDGTLVNRGHNARGLILAPPRTGADFELRGEFEVVSPRENDRDFSAVIGYRGGTAPRWIGCAVFQPGRPQMKAGIFENWKSTKRSQITDHAHTGKTRFFVRSANGRINFLLNDEPIITDWDPQRAPVLAGSRIGVGMWRFTEGNTTYIRNIELRQLKAL